MVPDLSVLDGPYLYDSLADYRKLVQDIGLDMPAHQDELDLPRADDIKTAIAAAFATGKPHLIEIEIEGKR